MMTRSPDVHCCCSTTCHMPRLGGSSTNDNRLTWQSQGMSTSLAREHQNTIDWLLSVAWGRQTLGAEGALAMLGRYWCIHRPHEVAARVVRKQSSLTRHLLVRGDFTSPRECHTHTHQFLQDCAPDPVNDGQPLVQWENRATTLTCLTMPVAAFWGEGFGPVAMFSAHVERRGRPDHALILAGLHPHT